MDSRLRANCEKQTVQHLEKIENGVIASGAQQAVKMIVSGAGEIAETAIEETPAGKDRENALKKFVMAEAEAKSSERIAKYGEA